MATDSVVKDELTALIRNFQGRRILVIGDIIVSRFVEVAARKLAREAPVPAGDYVGETFLPGGAANLARELTSLGASTSVVGLVGSDEYGTWVGNEFTRNGISHTGVLVDSSRPTSLRTWIMVNSFHTLRIDREDRRDVPFAMAKKMMAEAEPQIKEVDCVILSDYDRGAITSALINWVVAAAQESGKIVVAQPKNHHYLDFSGVTYVKSNLQEAAAATGMSIVNDTSLRNMGVNLLSRLECKGLLVTRGEEGITLFDKENVTHFPPLGGRKNLFSKVGVRDAMTGVFSLGVATGGSAFQAACLCNVAGAARSDLQRTASLSAADLENMVNDMDDFAQRVVQVPVRR
ncbi:MAG TPA: PfkB family carbohydrate kinase [Nitrososphaerales archaeon]|nr:PfkB family carbohydrate kinase [Nitrososphaerales archaeon]